MLQFTSLAEIVDQHDDSEYDGSEKKEVVREAFVG